ncbi:hypothetical protein HZU73_04368 [Apis mellifera caucasica]|uniref:RNA helicase n=1 Tax=Apis mellifera TaxID=7460 RepID=A0A7M7R995_APIME|nr:uncharacterized protein LOC551539 [Apis mellifera]KAG6800088.1 hypothetical protein HZU73_04368 [Apis mellifera caucasica]KAG9433101.1 hypothetical protein HZU67_05069 [Apis mellifera carnica]|eukprot:XP_625253.1 uncharacterized protein LOC551539 [Apis mellifera]
MNCPKLVSKYFTPKIIWYQTDTTVIVRILLQDIKEYFLRVKYDHLLFSTTVNSKNYYIYLYLFGTVIAEKTIHINLEREIKITLIKAHKWTEWLRLCIEKERNPLISVDSAHIYKRDWIIDSLKNIERESFAEYKRRHNITQIMPDVPSTDEEESDDEAMDMLFL